MRIGLNLLFLLPNEVGGTETYSASLVHALSQIDPNNEYYLFVNKESADIEWTDNPKFHQVVCSVRSKNRVARFLWEQCALPWHVLSYHLDVLHSLGYISPLILPCKSVVTIHDLNYIAIPEAFSWFTREVQRFFVTGSAKRANCIIAVSGFIKSEIIAHLKMPGEKIYTIYEAPKARIMDTRNGISWNQIRQRYAIREPYLLAFSSLAPHKNILRLLEAFVILRKQSDFKWQLVIIGHYPVKGPMLNVSVHTLGLEPNEVVLTGYLPDGEVAELLSHAALFAFPSLYEGFGLPVLEAMAAGVPVICSSRSSLPEIAGSAAIFFEPTDTQEIASILLRIANDEAGRQDLRERGWLNLQRFSWAETARRTVEVYRRSVSS